MLLTILLLVQSLSGWSAPVVLAATTGLKPLHLPTGTQTFKQFVKEGQHAPVKPYRLTGPLPPPPGTQHDTQGKLLPSAEPSTMKPLSATLDHAFLNAAPGTQPLDLHSSDGRLELHLVPGLFDLSHASVAGGSKTGATGKGGKTGSSGKPPATGGASSSSFVGSLIFTVTEQHGYYVGEQIYLGEYSFVLTDSHGHTVSGVVVRTPITLRYVYQKAVIDSFDLDPGRLFLDWPVAIMNATKQHKIDPTGMLPLHNDPKTHTLTTPLSELGPGPFDLMGDPSNESPPIPHLAGVQGNSGQLSYSYPIQTPPGPNGFGPDLQLTYSSETVNERHAYNQPAGPFGDGFSLSLGSITADVSAGTGATWYSISGVDGISDRIVPTQTPNVYSTQHLSYLKIVYDTTNTCFHVWDPSGTYYEFGCTPSSLQFHTDTDGTQHLYRWDVNKIVAPNEGNTSTVKSMTISYFQDCYPKPNPGAACSSPSTPGASVHDAAIKQITVFVGNINGGTIVSTTDFFYQSPYTVTPWATAYGTNYNTYPGYSCSPPGAPGNPSGQTTLRCDDPVNYSGGMPAPPMMSTLSLQKIVSYVGTDPYNGSGSTPAYQYSFAYQDTPFNAFGNGMQCADPVIQIDEFCAGEHLLTNVTESVYNSGAWHQLKPVLFDYAQHTNTYTDFTEQIPPGSGNPYHIQIIWQYLADYIDTNTGVGGHIVYMTGYGNTHGTPVAYNGSQIADDRHDPTYCFQHPSGNLACTGTFAGPDDGQWTVQLVTSITTLGSDSSGLAPTTTNYTYRLADIPNDTSCPPAGGETDCPTDSWRPLLGKDTDWQDYYDEEFFGFNGVTTTSPSGNVSIDLYYSTEGFGFAYSNYGNYTNGHPYQQDVYQLNTTTNPPTLVLLQDTTTQYGGWDKKSNACNGNFGGTYPACEVMIMNQTTNSCEGNSSCPGGSPVTWPQVTTSNTWDDFTEGSGLAYQFGHYHNLLQQQITSNDTPTVPGQATITKKWTYQPDDQTIGNTVYYDVNKVIHSEVDDSNGTVWQCQDTTYDEGNTSGVASGIPVAGWPTTVTTYSNCADPTHTAITTYTGYDAYGNTVAAVDGVAAANSSLYGSSGTAPDNGCTLPTAPVIMGANWTKTNYTTCTTYDQYNGQAFEALPASVTNAFGQTTTYGYDYTQGELPVSLTDANQQQTTTAYIFDSGSSTNDKRTINVSEPGECGTCYTKQSTTSSSCAESLPTSTTAPCFEITSSTSEYASEVSSTFYDSLGRAVETSVPTASPNPTDGKAYFTVTMTEYNDANATTWTSEPFVVAVTPGQGGVTGTGWLDPATITDYNGHAPVGTTAFLDAQGRTIAVRDPLYGTQSEPGVTCGQWLPGSYTACTNYSIGQLNGGAQDPNYYVTATGVDPNGHVGESFADALGRTVYTEQFSGVYGGTLTAVQQTSMLYTILGQPTQVQVQDLQPQTNQSIALVTTTASYDSLGRLLTLNDPDRGTHTYTYDPDGHMLTDVSGTRTLGSNYDLLGRLGCLQDAAPTINATGACSSGTNPYMQNSYDSSSVNWGSTDYSVGRLAQSIATTYYPGSNTMTTTEKFEYDQRGRPITAQLSLSLPSAWNVTSLPTYQMATDYTDADQPLTTTTGTLASGTLTTDFTSTQVYDPASGVQDGLGTNPDSTTINVASLVYNANALPDTITFDTSAGQSSPLATEQFTYDANLRPAQTTATWQSGSGSSGQIYQEQRTYDPLGNVSSLATSLSPVPGKSNSGGAETQDFCYNEQNQLVWAGNSGTEPGAGNGTCGSAALASGLYNAAYSNSFVYTHLGQLWKGPLNGSSTQYKYLYCSSGSNTPHQLTGIFPIGGGASCSNQTGAVYTSSYDAWGNVTSRTYNGTTPTLSYDLLDHLVEWNSGGTNREWYGYDASGQRTLKRSLTGSGTTITVYAFGGEYTYNGSGTLQSSTHYYTLAGRLIGELTANPGQNTNIFLTDALGSVIATFSNVVGSAAVLANQVYGPYGTERYKSGPMPTYTTKGFTGQYADAVTGLDYYNARYYDPVAGVFLAADTVQGNMQGMNPYGYVNGNPETNTDPTGRYYAPPGGPGGPTPPPPCNQSNNFCNTGNGNNPNGGGTKQTQKKTQVNLGGCNDTCVARDEERIKNYLMKQQAQSQIGPDIGSILVDIAATLADMATDSWAAVAIDLIAGLIPHVTALINAILIASGHVVSQLQQFLTAIQGAANFIIFMKGYFFLLGGVSVWLSPVLQKTGKVVMLWVFSGLGSMVSGTMGMANTNPPDPNDLFAGKDPTQIQDLCVYYFGEGKGC